MWLSAKLQSVSGLGTGVSNKAGQERRQDSAGYRSAGLLQLVAVDWTAEDKRPDSGHEGVPKVVIDKASAGHGQASKTSQHWKDQLIPEVVLHQKKDSERRRQGDVQNCTLWNCRRGILQGTASKRKRGEVNLGGKAKAHDVRTNGDGDQRRRRNLQIYRVESFR